MRSRRTWNTSTTGSAAFRRRWTRRPMSIAAHWQRSEKCAPGRPGNSGSDSKQQKPGACMCQRSGPSGSPWGSLSAPPLRSSPDGCAEPSYPFRLHCQHRLRLVQPLPAPGGAAGRGRLLAALAARFQGDPAGRSVLLPSRRAPQGHRRLRLLRGLRARARMTPQGVVRRQERRRHVRRDGGAHRGDPPSHRESSPRPSPRLTPVGAAGAVMLLSGSRPEGLRARRTRRSVAS